MFNKTDTIESKKIGSIIISIEENYVTIKTERLSLSSLNQYDTLEITNHYKLLLGKVNNVQMFRDGNPWNEESVKKFITTQTNKWNEGDRFGVFSVNDLNSNTFIGSLNIYYPSPGYDKIGRGHENVAEIGYIIDHTSWGKGYGTEMAIIGKKYIQYLVSQSKENQGSRLPDEIVATVHPNNFASVKILQNTLKKKEDSLLSKFDSQPRILFFKPLKKEQVKNQKGEIQSVSLLNTASGYSTLSRKIS